MTSEPDQRKRRRRLVRWYLGGGFGCVCIVLLFVNPSEASFLPACVFKATTGFHCPGCGATRARKRWLIVSLVVNLGILGLFKYADFFVDSFAALLARFDVDASPGTLSLVLPIGISFYTFQSLSYTMDVYRRRVEPERDVLDFALYVAFFPQLVAGPIERAKRLLPQIKAARVIGWDRFHSGSWLVLIGLAKKVVVADNLALLVDQVFGAPGEATGAEILVASYAFAWQIYCDFSGYTDIARGIARMLGFDLMLNFDLPYLARNPTDFWRRWHISLSSWFRDYLYIPLGGNRSGAGRTYLNLVIVFLLCGLWHGAGWTFVLWGGYHGVLLIGDRLRVASGARLVPAGRTARAAVAVVATLVTFHLTCFGWLIFRAESIADFAVLSRGLVDLRVGDAALWLRPLAILTVPLILLQLMQAWSRNLECVLRWPLPVRALTYAGAVLSILLIGQDLGQPFIYFQF